MNDRSEIVRRAVDYLTEKFAWDFHGNRALEAISEACKLIAWTLRGEGVGLFAKGGESSFDWHGQTFKANRLVYHDGTLVKIFTDSGNFGANGPEWVEDNLPEFHAEDAARWVAPIDPGYPEFESGVEPPIPTPPPPNNADIQARFDKVDAALAVIARQAQDQHDQVMDRIETVVTNAEKSVPGLLLQLAVIIRENR